MRHTLLSLALLFSFAASALASPIIVGGSGAYSGWTMGTSTFWNNISRDRNGQANIGQFLSGTPGSDVPGFYTNSPYLFPAQLGYGSTQFGWNGSIDVRHLLSVTGWQETFGVYDLNTGTRYPIGATRGALAGPTNFPVGQWGFYLTSGEGRTWESAGPLDGGRSHFALFNAGDTYWLGIEDATFSTRPTADWDYNDVVLAFNATPVPEPGSMTMLGIGLLVLARKMRKTTKEKR